MKDSPVPGPVIERIPLYLRELERLRDEGQAKASSRQLAQSLGLSAAQVRKDLAFFGQFGRPGLGYRVEDLIRELRRILGTDRPLKVVVVGVGDLGRALLRFRGFAKKGFRLVAAFDVDKRKVGKRVGGVTVRHLRELPEVVRRDGVRLAVLSTPIAAAQDVADMLSAAGIRGIIIHNS